MKKEENKFMRRKVKKGKIDFQLSKWMKEF